MSFKISLSAYLKRMQEAYSPHAVRTLLKRDEFNSPDTWSASAVLHQLDLSASFGSTHLQEQLEVLIVFKHFAFVKYAGGNDWVNVSNHDSCWISGIESAADDVQRRLISQLTAGQEDVPTLDYQCWPWSPKQVVVHYAPDKERNKRHGSTYWLKIDSVKPASS